jgi:uncharacterized protein YndB with AHSA1/START domain
VDGVRDTIVREVVVKAPIARVWELLIDPQQLARWYPGARLEPRVGGMATFDCGAEAPYYGVIELVEPPRRLAWRWCLAAGVPVGQGPTTRVEIALSPAGADTRVLLTESGFAALSPEERARCQPDNDAGWEMLLGALASQVFAPAAR